MTHPTFEAFMDLTKEDLNAFLKAKQDELTLTDAEVQTFLEMKVDGFDFVLLTEEKLETKLHVRELATRKRIRKLIIEMRTSAAKVTTAKFHTKKSTSIIVPEKTAIKDNKLGSHKWPAIVSEWNFVKDILLWRQKYRNSLSQTVPNMRFQVCNNTPRRTLS